MIQISVIKGLDEFHLKKLRYHLAGHLLCTDNDKDIYLLSITRRFLTDAQTDAQNVPVDCESMIRKLAVMLM